MDQNLPQNKKAQHRKQPCKDTIDYGFGLKVNLCNILSAQDKCEACVKYYVNPKMVRHDEPIFENSHILREYGQ